MYEIISLCICIWICWNVCITEHGMLFAKLHISFKVIMKTELKVDYIFRHNLVTLLWNISFKVVLKIEYNLVSLFSNLDISLEGFSLQIHNLVTLFLDLGQKRNISAKLKYIHWNWKIVYVHWTDWCHLWQCTCVLK